MQHPSLGDLLSSAKHLYSSMMTGLNDQSSEYLVSTVKHFFDKYIIIQYCVTNTLEDHILSQIKLTITGIESASDLEIKGVALLAEGDSIKYSERKYLYAVIAKARCEHPYPVCKISQKMEFTITEIDVDSKDELGSW